MKIDTVNLIFIIILLKAKATTTMSKKGLKICNHPSIWNRDYRWTTTLNGASTTKTAPKLAAAKKSPMPSKRITKIPTYDDDDEDADLPTESQNDEMLLNQYISEPLSKRFKDDTNGEMATLCSQTTSTQITPTRNPFKKSESPGDVMLSPTRISKENNSLVNTQSPVKQIEYRRLKQLSKISQFSRTVVPKEQSVISRFFNASHKDDQEPPAASIFADSSDQHISSASNDDSIGVKKQASVEMKSPNLLDRRKITPNPALYFANSDESPGQSEKGADDDDLENIQTQRVVVEKFKLVLKDRFEAPSAASISADSSGQENALATNDDCFRVRKRVSAEMKSPSLLSTRKMTPHPALCLSQSEKVADDDENIQTQRVGVEKFKFVPKDRAEAPEQNASDVANSQGTCDKTDSETDELPIILSDDDIEVNCNPNAAGQGSSSNRNCWLPSSQKTKNVRQNFRLFQ